MKDIPKWVRQPDGYTCGAASTLWALRFLGGHGRLSLKGLSDELHVKRCPWWLRAIARINDMTERDMYGTLPSSVLRVMLSYGHVPVVPGFSNYIEKTLDLGGVCLVGYCVETRRGLENHWVAVARDRMGYLVVMDPSRGMAKGAKAQRHNCFRDDASRVVIGYCA